MSLFCKKSWGYESAASLSSTFLLANLTTEDVQRITVIGAHIHHKLGLQEA